MHGWQRDVSLCRLCARTQSLAAQRSDADTSFLLVGGRNTAPIPRERSTLGWLSLLDMGLSLSMGETYSWVSIYIVPAIVNYRCWISHRHLNLVA